MKFYAKLIAITAIGLAAAVAVGSSPAVAQEDRERELLMQMLENSQKELQQFQRQHGLPLSKPLPPITIPAVPVYKLPPDPYAPPTFVAPMKLKQRCTMIGETKTCFLGI